MKPRRTEIAVAQPPVASLAAAAEASESMTAVASSRVAQEVQAAMVVAKRFRRNESQALERILAACRRRSLAETAMYSYPRGRTLVTGPSIRLAEVMAQNWGNLDFGVIEVDQREGESTMMAYAWDLETNTRQTKVFQVKHERRVGRGDDRKRIVQLDDPRDIYEATANQAARRLRACILGIIPGDIVERAVEECAKTLASSSEPLAARIQQMLQYFQGTFGVSRELIEARLGHRVESCTETELVTLKTIAQALRDGMGVPADYFNVETVPVPPGESDKAEALAAKLESALDAKIENQLEIGDTGDDNMT